MHFVWQWRRRLRQARRRSVRMFQCECNRNARLTWDLHCTIVIWSELSPRRVVARPMANLNATLTCPHCGHQSHEVMPTDRCIVVYECPACAGMLRPRPGDCCVFCSYADRPCPPIQDADSRDTRISGEDV